MIKQFCDVCGGEIHRPRGPYALGLFEMKAVGKTWIIYVDPEPEEHDDQQLCLRCIYKALKKHYGDS